MPSLAFTTVSFWHRYAGHALTLAIVVAVKALILFLDDTPRFFLWDSVTYLRGAVEGLLPRDRSFLYSMLIGGVAAPLRSLRALVVIQTIAGVTSALLVYVILRSFLAVPFRFAVVGALLVAVEPSQLLYERMVMAEAFGGTIWLIFVLLAMRYLRDGGTLTLLATALAGIVTVAFRLNGTATIIVIGGLLPMWRIWFRVRAENGNRALPTGRRRLIAHLIIALMSTTVLHLGYRDLVGTVAHTQPGYIGTEGLFLLGYVAPAVSSEDFANTGCNPNILQNVTHPLSDPRNRNYQLWGTNGLWAAIEHDCAQPETVADKVAHAASRRIARYVLPMALSIAAQYFDDEEANWRMQSDLGREAQLPLELIRMAKDYFDFDVAAVAFADTLVTRWFSHSRWWLTGCFFLAPFMAIILVSVTRKEPSGPYAKLLGLVLVSMFCTQFLFSPLMEFRYLHPFPPLMIAGFIAVLTRFSVNLHRQQRAVR